MENKYRPLILAWLAFIISEVIAVCMVYYLTRLKNAAWVDDKTMETSWTPDAVGLGISMIILNGHGMVIFRLLPGCKTRVLKYVHALIHTVVLVGAVYAYNFIRFHKISVQQTYHFYFNHLHVTMASLTLITYIIQWLSGIFVFLYMYENQRRRKLFAVWHNFIGFCILQFAIDTTCAVLLAIDSERNLGVEIAGTTMILTVIYGMLINVIVLNPYLEWPLVGPI